jgi:uncharacterized Zn-finger protein
MEKSKEEIKIHGEEKKEKKIHKCIKCGRSYNRADNLKKHSDKGVCEKYKMKPKRMTKEERSEEEKKVKCLCGKVIVREKIIRHFASKKHQVWRKGECAYENLESIFLNPHLHT